MTRLDRVEQRIAELEGEVSRLAAKVRVLQSRPAPRSDEKYRKPVGPWEGGPPPGRRTFEE